MNARKFTITVVATMPPQESNAQTRTERDAELAKAVQSVTENISAAGGRLVRAIVDSGLEVQSATLRSENEVAPGSHMPADVVVTPLELSNFGAPIRNEPENPGPAKS